MDDKKLLLVHCGGNSLEFNVLRLGTSDDQATPKKLAYRVNHTMTGRAVDEILFKLCSEKLVTESFKLNKAGGRRKSLNDQNALDQK